MSLGFQPKHVENIAQLQNSRGSLEIIARHYDSVRSKDFKDLLATTKRPYVIGIAAEYENATSQDLRALSFASASRVLTVNIDIDLSNTENAVDDEAEDGGEVDVDEDVLHESYDWQYSDVGPRALERFLQDDDCVLLAFNADRLALSLHHTARLRIKRLIDLQATLEATWRFPRTAMETYAQVISNSKSPSLAEIRRIFGSEASRKTVPEALLFRAWSAYASQYFRKLGASLPLLRNKEIDTSKLNDKILEALAKLYHDGLCLDGLKPAFTEMDVGSNTPLQIEYGLITIPIKQYQDRIKKGAAQSILIRVQNEYHPLLATVEHEKEHSVVLRLRGNPTKRTVKVTSLAVIGRADPTLAEADKSQIVLHILQRANNLFDGAIPRYIWQGKDWAIGQTQVFPPEFGSGLNTSQRAALDIMLAESDSPQLPIIVGPPGTGKTMIISAFARTLADSNKPVWLVAQSNVGVKNIAERLQKDGFHAWRLLISQDFSGWHQDLYRHFNPGNMILSSTFHESRTNKQLGSARVILCTLNLLCSSRLAKCGFMTRVPVHTLVVDEASQIELGALIPALEKYRHIRKICFFGDDKQLPPYGTEEIPDLQSIFEVTHLREKAVFLDMQYRMPTAIADFISREVYAGQLNSQPRSQHKAACRFIDAGVGHEEYVSRPSGKSWENPREADIIKLLVKQAQKNKLDWRVVTPYDAQRVAITDRLKQSKTDLPSEDRVFNIDSFQGNEADIIFVSLVRNKATPFLRNIRRMNVMLTRAKRGLFICGSMEFLRSESMSSSLLGLMLAQWEKDGEDVVKRWKQDAEGPTDSMEQQRGSGQAENLFSHIDSIPPPFTTPTSQPLQPQSSPPTTRPTGTHRGTSSGRGVRSGVSRSRRELTSAWGEPNGTSQAVPHDVNEVLWTNPAGNLTTSGWDDVATAGGPNTTNGSSAKSAQRGRRGRAAQGRGGFQKGQHSGSVPASSRSQDGAQRPSGSLQNWDSGSIDTPLWESSDGDLPTSGWD